MGTFAEEMAEVATPHLLAEGARECLGRNEAEGVVRRWNSGLNVEVRMDRALSEVWSSSNSESSAWDISGLTGAKLGTIALFDKAGEATVDEAEPCQHNVVFK